MSFKETQPLPPYARLTYEGSLFRVYQWIETGFDGRPYIFEKVIRPDAVVLLPVMGRRIILAWERQPASRTVLGFLGGRVEPCESIEEAARRELAEEAGLTAGSLQHWESVRASTKVDWSVHFFSARDLCLAASEPQPDERIELRHLNLDGFISAVTSPDFGDPVAALPILRILSRPNGRAALASRLFGTVRES